MLMLRKYRKEWRGTDMGSPTNTPSTHMFDQVLHLRDSLQRSEERSGTQIVINNTSVLNNTE